MIYRSLALVSMATFYIIYFVKLFLQKKRGIRVYKLAQNEKKSKKNITEILLKIVSFLLPVLELVSIVIGRSYLPIMGKVIGVYFAFFADFLFLNAVISMKDSWRVGVAEDEKDRKLITSGIYKFSRNPAFLAFDLLYIGIVLMYCNIPLIICTLAALVIFHLQILSEEKFLKETLKEEAAKAPDDDDNWMNDLIG